MNAASNKYLFLDLSVLKLGKLYMKTSVGEGREWLFISCHGVTSMAAYMFF